MNKPLLIALVCLLVSCGIPSHTRSKINIAEFNAKQVHDTVRLSLIHNIELIETRLPDGSFLATSIHPGYVDNWASYYYPSGNLKSSVSTAHGFKHGKSPLYNENGDLVSITDYDTPFKISLNRLSAKFAFGYGLDIFKQGTSIIRSTEETPVYKITIPINTPEGNKARRFIVDGITGKMLSDIITTQ